MIPLRAFACPLLLTLCAWAESPTFAPTIAQEASSQGGAWMEMSVGGKTTLPPRAILEVFLYYEGEDEPYLLDQGRCEVKDGAYTIRLGRTNGPPLSGTYRAEVVFSPDRQRDEVIQAMSPTPAGELREVARLPLGKPEDREADIARERERLRKDLDELTSVADAFEKHLAEERKTGFDRERYRAWHEGWAKRLAACEEANRQRPYAKILEVAGVGQARIEGMAQILHEAAEAPLGEGNPETLFTKLSGAIEAYHDRLKRVVLELAIESAAGLPPFDASPFEKLAEELAERWKKGPPDEAFLAPWRARWTEAFCAALPSLAAASDRVSTDLAALGPRLAGAQDAASLAAQIAALQALLESIAPKGK